MELVNIRLVASVTSAPPVAVTYQGPELQVAKSDSAMIQRSEPNFADVWFEATAPIQAKVLPRSSLAPGDRIEGPAIIAQFDATTLLPPGALLTVEPSDSLIIEITP